MVNGQQFRRASPTLCIGLVMPAPRYWRPHRSMIAIFNRHVTWKRLKSTVPQINFRRIVLAELIIRRFKMDLLFCGTYGILSRFTNSREFNRLCR